MTRTGTFGADIARADLQPICKATVATAFVHLCETRQVLNVFGEDIVWEVLAEPTVWRQPVKTALNALQVTGTSKESHAVTLVRVAAVAMSIVIPAKRRRKTCTTDPSRQLLIALGAAGLNPKALLVGIPEWRAMYVGLMAIASVLSKQSKKASREIQAAQTSTFAALMSLARKRGVKAQSYKHGQRVSKNKKDLVRSLTSQSFEKVMVPMRRGLRLLRDVMRKHHGSPLPRIKGERVALSKASITQWLQRRNISIP
jgi:hypothetical protein